MAAAALTQWNDETVLLGDFVSSLPNAMAAIVVELVIKVNVVIGNEKLDSNKPLLLSFFLEIKMKLRPSTDFFK